MPVSTRIYAGGAIGFGGEPAIVDLRMAEYSTVLIWSVHVDADGDLYLNDTRIVHEGAYDEAVPMGLPVTVAQLRGAGLEIIFSVGAGGTKDFTHINALLEQNPKRLIDNFLALKNAMTDVGGDIDGIDFDNEDLIEAGVMVKFGELLRTIGLAHVTLCPYGDLDTWKSTLSALNEYPQGRDFVNAVHLQCYSGGQYNQSMVQTWQDMITAAVPVGPRPLLIPGLATNQPQPGPWWDGNSDQPGRSLRSRPGFAMDGRADWSKHIFTGSFQSVNEALRGVQSRGGITFFFYCNDAVNLGGRPFQKGDTVCFAGQPSWAPTAACDGYYLADCTDQYNGIGACPADLQAQYKTWSTVQTPPQGGFIWLYDSVVWSFLAGTCGSTEQNPGPTARDYRDAIVWGLSPGT